jgi:hypothetical protein
MIAVLLLTAVTVSTGGQAPAPVAPPTQPPVAAAAAPVSTAGDLWLVIYSVLPDRAAEFEGIGRQVREALARSADEARRTQARDLRLHRSALPNTQGRHMYFLQLPATQGDAERSGYDALIDAVLPEQATALKKQLVSVLDPANPSGNTYLISIK